jgi:hypothetical protein
MDKCTKRINAVIHCDLYIELQDVALSEGRSINYLVTASLTKFIKERKRKRNAKKEIHAKHNTTN